MKLVLYLTLITAFICCQKSNSETNLNNNNVVQIVKEQTCDSCNIELIKRLRFAKKEPVLNDLVSFLGCCNPECWKNSEYAQAANYSLFILIQRYPDMIISTLEKDEYDFDFIANILENPISEEVDISKTISAVKSSKKEGLVKSKLLKSLSIAKSKL